MQVVYGFGVGEFVLCDKNVEISGLILRHLCEISVETPGGVCCRTLGVALFAVTGQCCLHLSKPFEFFYFFFLAWYSVT